MPTKSPLLGKAERKYLERHAEPEAACASALAESEPPHAARCARVTGTHSCARDRARMREGRMAGYRIGLLRTRRGSLLASRLHQPPL